MALSTARAATNMIFAIIGALLIAALAWGEANGSVPEVK